MPTAAECKVNAIMRQRHASKDLLAAGPLVLTPDGDKKIVIMQIDICSSMSADAATVISIDSVSGGLVTTEEQAQVSGYAVWQSQYWPFYAGGVGELVTVDIFYQLNAAFVEVRVSYMEV